MEAKLKDRQAVEATVEVTIPAAEVDKAFDRVLRGLSQQIKVPGFRPGKAPRGVLVKRLGKEALEGEVREELIDSSFQQAMKQFELLPVHTHVHGGSPVEGQDFTFDFHVDLYPEIQLPELDQIVIDSAGRQVDDDMVATTVARLQSENATMIPVDRPVEPGDYLLVETVSDEADGEGSSMPIDLESVGDELAQQLVGRNAGDLVTLRLAGSEAGATRTEATDEVVAEGTESEAAGSDAAGSDTDGADGADDGATTEREDGSAGAGALEGEQDEPPTLTVRIKDVKAKEKPAADDEFAKTLGFDSWQETEERIRKSLQEQLDQEAFEEQREEFVEKLMASASFELPRSLVQRRRADLLENLREDLKQRGMTIEAYVARLEESGGREDFERELQEAAEKGVRRDLLLERLLEERGTRLSEPEFELSLRQVAAQQGTDVERLRRERGEDWLRNYRFLLTRDRALREALEERLAAQGISAYGADAGTTTSTGDASTGDAATGEVAAEAVEERASGAESDAPENEDESANT